MMFNQNICALGLASRTLTVMLLSDQMPRDLRAHGSPQPEPRLLPSDPYTSPRGGDVVSHFVTLLSPEGARYPRLSTADSTDSAVALLSQEPLVRTECLAGEGTPPSPARPARARSFSPPTTPLDLRAHGSPQPEPRLLPSDPYTSPRGGDVVTLFFSCPQELGECARESPVPPVLLAHGFLLPTLRSL